MSAVVLAPAMLAGDSRADMQLTTCNGYSSTGILAEGQSACLGGFVLVSGLRKAARTRTSLEGRRKQSPLLVGFKGKPRNMVHFAERHFKFDR